MTPFPLDQHHYMHKDALDVCIFVVKVQYRGQDYVRLKVDYMNLGYSGHPALILRKNNFVVMEENYADWIHISDEDLKIVRTKPGLPSFSL